LIDFYAAAFRKKDKAEVFRLFDWHYHLVAGKDNMCEFNPSEEFMSFFGPDGGFAGKAAVRRVNFDAVAGNVILVDGDFTKPCFIDYEWVFDFMIPVALLKFHLISRIYLYISGLNELIPEIEFFERALCARDEIRLSRVLYERFIVGIIETGKYNLEIINTRYERNDISLTDKITELECGLDWHRDYVRRQQEHIEFQNERLSELESSLDWHRDYVRRQQEHIECQNERLSELESSLDWHRDYVRRQQEHIEYQNEHLSETRTSNMSLEQENKKMADILYNLNKHILGKAISKLYGKG
jgi:hypothetical protein